MSERDTRLVHMNVLKEPHRIVDDLVEIVEGHIPVDAIDRFVARDRFVIGRDGELPISYLGDDFTQHFLGVVEEGVAPTTLRLCKLLKGSVDGPIFAALGGRDNARVALAHLFQFLKIADRKRWYFSYVEDASGELWAIDMYWRDNGWDVEAYSVTYPRGWRGGGRIIAG